MPSMYIQEDPMLIAVAASLEEAAVSVRRFSNWVGGTAQTGQWALVGSGSLEHRTFDWRAVGEMASWLHEADVLDTYLLADPVTLSGDELVGAFSTLADFLEKFGDMFTRPPDPSVVIVTRGITELALLRYALQVAIEVREQPGPLTRRLVREEGYRAGAWVDFWARRGLDRSSTEGLAASARTWFAWKVAYEGPVRPMAWLEGPEGRVRVLAVPATGLQALWWVAAITAGALEPPFPIPGLARCGDPKCAKLFALRPGRRNRKDRTRAFCSPECARKFHKREWARSHPRKQGRSGPVQHQVPREFEGGQDG